MPRGVWYLLAMLLFFGILPTRAEDVSLRDVPTVRALIQRGDWLGARSLAARHIQTRGTSPAWISLAHGSLNTVHTSGTPTQGNTQARSYLGCSVAAAIVGLPELAATYAEKALATALEKEQQRIELIEFVYPVIRCRLISGDLAGAIDCATYIYDSDWRKNLTAILITYQQAPDDPAARLAVLQHLYGYLEFRFASGYDWELQFIRTALAAKPKPDIAIELILQQCRFQLKYGERDLLEPFIRKALQQYGDDSRLISALFKYAHPPTSDSTACTRFLNEIITRWPTSYCTAQAHFELAGLAKQADNIDLWQVELEKCAAGQEPTRHQQRFDNEHYFFDIRSAAHKMLAGHYFAEKDFAKALPHSRAVKIEGWCGNGREGDEVEKTVLTARCLIGLGQLDAASTELQPLLKCSSFDNGFYHEIPPVLVDLYRRRGQLDALLTQSAALVAKAEDWYEYPIAREVVALVQYDTWVREKNYPALLAALKPDKEHGRSISQWQQSNQYWRPILAAKALASIGGDEFPALKAEYQRLLALVDVNNYSTGQDQRTGVLYAMVLSHSTDVTPYLRELLIIADESFEGITSGQIGQAIARCGASPHELRTALKMRAPR